MNATATITPAPQQYMRALERANEVRLARAELKRRVAGGKIDVAEVILYCPREAGEHGGGRPADQPAPLGSDPLPQASRPDPAVREQDRRVDDRPTASRTGDDAGVHRSGPRVERQPVGSGQSDEYLTRHQPESPRAALQ